MATVINLRQARKNRDRKDKADRAQANRVAHGRTRQERDQSAHDAAKAALRHEGHRIDEQGLDHKTTRDPAAVGAKNASSKVSGAKPPVSGMTGHKNHGGKRAGPEETGDDQT